MFQRRQFIKGAAASLSSLTFIKPAFAQAGLSVIPVAEDIVLISGAGENLIANQSSKGLLLIDSGSVEFSDAILSTLQREFGTQQISTLINTHWHPAQTGLNQVLGSAGTEIIAHENTRLWMSTKTIVRWQDKVYPPAPLSAQPNTSFYDTHTLKVDGEEINCGYLLQAHTDGDITAHFTERNILAVGGALSTNSWPVIDWSTAGWIGGMLRSLEVLIEQADDNTIIIPATGAPTNKAELISQHAMYTDIMGKLKVMMESGYDITRVIADTPTAGYKPEWGNSDFFLSLAFRSFWGHVRQFDVV